MGFMAVAYCPSMVFEDVERREGNAVAKAAKYTDLFRGMDKGDMYHLAQIGRLKTFPQSSP